jgi:hypothetical protein
MSRLLIELVQEKIVNIVIATSTLTEGINLPFEIILIPSLRRATDYLSLREFANLIGRAGRPGISTEGRSLVVMDPTSTAPGQYGTRMAYENLIRELSSGSSDISAPKKDRGPLANLLKYIEEKWVEISRDAKMAEFVNWLENTVCESISDEMNDATKALDTLDGILIEAIEEQEQNIDTELTDTDLESFIQNLWRNSFSYYSAMEKDRLETILLTRGKSLTSKIYPEKSVRQKLYKTSLPPREGKILIDKLSKFHESLKLGEDYYIWSSEKRVEYIADLIQTAQLVPSFSLSKPKGKTNWLDILHWWLDPESAPVKPTPTAVSNWYDYGSKNFSYRFNWSLGCIFSLLLESALTEKSIFDRWTETKLPWSVFWLKDLITWGILDPVSVLILMKGKASARQEAKEIANEYYEKYEGADGDVIFDPQKISEWFFEKYAQEADAEKDLTKELIFPAKILENFEEKSKLDWYVLPIQTAKSIKWIDPAGFPLAESKRPAKWHEKYLKNYDFILRPNKRKVFGHPYL